MPWLYLSLAIACEIVGTLTLKASAGFTNALFAGLALCFYGFALFFLSHALKTIPLGLAYAVWSGIGIASIATLGVVLYGQRLDWPATIGIALIAGGILVINFSTTSAHP
ncbi:MAG: multidrug efflux SMR transporter [Beijerinckiaceae bacterium]